MSELVDKLKALVSECGDHRANGDSDIWEALDALPADWDTALVAERDEYADKKYAGMVQAFEFERRTRIQLEAQGKSGRAGFGTIIEQYGQHKLTCDVSPIGGQKGEPPYQCDCGFDAVMQGHKERETERGN